MRIPGSPLVVFMIKLIILDCDGVAVSAKEIHYESLNAALSDIAPNYVIGYDDHIANFDGRPSRVKLSILNNRGLDQNLWKLKQDYTTFFIRKLINKDDYINQVNSIRKLKELGYKTACASNSIFETLKLMLDCAGYTPYLDYIISNEGVKNPKPNPEIYLRTFIKLEEDPRNSLILEDSNVGIEAATRSGGWVMKVESPKDVTFENIKMYLNFIDSHS